MTSLILMHHSLGEMYVDLLTKRRKIERLNQSETVCCRLCKKPKSEHLSDGRCEVYATSLNFVSENESEATAIDRALVLIEELRDLQY